MLVGVFGDEAVYSGLLEVSITMCICTNWMGRGLRLGEIYLQRSFSGNPFCSFELNLSRFGLHRSAAY